MARISLIHWNDEEAAPRILQLLAAGYEVDYRELTPQLMRDWRGDPPLAFVIDLSRLPSHGLEVALSLRVSKATRMIPLVFVEGEKEKVARVRRHLPDAVYTTWGRIQGALRSAIKKPPAKPAVPESVLAGYSGTPLPKKLGIKAGATVVLLNAPKDFERTLGRLPDGAKIARRAGRRNDLTLWFVKSRKDLESGIVQRAEQIGADGLWIAWPKQSSGVKSDVTQALVREIGLANGLVDFKICAIDDTWSGLRFSLRRK